MRDPAYRFAVLPLGIFFVLGGIVAIATAIWMPPEAMLMPPFEDPSLKRLIMAGLAIPVFAIGLGLCRRSKTAWYGLFLYMLTGTIWHVVVGLLDPQFRFLAIASPVLNGAIGVGLYLVTKPAFVREDQLADASEANHSSFLNS
jgi:hypothetical protein